MAEVAAVQLPISEVIVTHVHAIAMLPLALHERQLQGGAEVHV